MLNIDRKQLLSLNEDVVKKQRVLLLITGCLLLAGGIFCLVNPFASGVALSTLAGVMFLLSGVGLIIGMIANRSHNFGPMLGGILLGDCLSDYGICFYPQSGGRHYGHVCYPGSTVRGWRDYSSVCRVPSAGS